MQILGQQQTLKSKSKHQMVIFDINKRVLFVVTKAQLERRCDERNVCCIKQLEGRGGESDMCG